MISRFLLWRSRVSMPRFDGDVRLEQSFDLLPAVGLHVVIRSDPQGADYQFTPNTSPPRPLFTDPLYHSLPFTPYPCKVSAQLS